MARADGNNGDYNGPGGRFLPGNPGRPMGSRHKVTLAIESLLEGEAEKLTRKCVERAMAALLGAVAAGELSPTEATEMAKLVEAHRRTVELRRWSSRSVCDAWKK